MSPTEIGEGDQHPFWGELGSDVAAIYFKRHLVSQQPNKPMHQKGPILPLPPCRISSAVPVLWWDAGAVSPGSSA